MIALFSMCHLSFVILYFDVTSFFSFPPLTPAFPPFISIYFYDYTFSSVGLATEIAYRG